LLRCTTQSPNGFRQTVLDEFYIQFAPKDVNECFVYWKWPAPYTQRIAYTSSFWATCNWSLMFSDHRIICISSLYWGHPNFRAHWLITEPSFSIFIFVMNIAVIGILFMLNQSPINWIWSLVSIIYNVCSKTVYILDRIICLLCVYICHYIFPFYYLDIFF
jgi:hypothetical protein